jgi:predicted nuclease with TOPRIM domain
MPRGKMLAPSKEELREQIEQQQNVIASMNERIAALEAENASLHETVKMQMGDLNGFRVLLQTGFRQNGEFFFDRFVGERDEIELTVLRCSRELLAQYIAEKGK